MKVVITSVTRNAGLAAVRALGQAGIEVVGTDDRELPFGIRSRYLRKHYTIPSKNAPDFAGALLEVVRREKPDVLLPLGGINVVVDHGREFEKLTHLLVPEPESFRAAYDNRLTLLECLESGIPAPRVLEEADALEELEPGSDRPASRFGVVVKPRGEIGGGAGVHFVGTKEALSEAQRKIESAYGASVIQEYIPGETDAMKTVNLVFDRDSRLAAYFTTRKIRQWPTSGGISALSVSTDERDLVRTVLPLFEKWKWRGPAEVEFKVDARDGVPKLIEINPRFWGYLGFPIRCGVNFPLIACRLAMGERADSSGFPPYREGIKYVNPFAYLKAVRHDIVHGGSPVLAISNGWSDLRGKKVLNNIQWSDTLAVLGKLAAELKPSKAKAFWFVPEKEAGPK